VSSPGAQTEVPYAPSPVIRGANWEFEHLIRLASNPGKGGSDLWPTTWTADGNVYTGCGDGGRLQRGVIALAATALDFKWMSRDGMTLWAVFSGGRLERNDDLLDSLNLVKLTLLLRRTVKKILIIQKDDLVVYKLVYSAKHSTCSDNFGKINESHTRKLRAARQLAGPAMASNSDLMSMSIPVCGIVRTYLYQSETGLLQQGVTQTSNVGCFPLVIRAERRVSGVGGC